MGGEAVTLPLLPRVIIVARPRAMPPRNTIGQISQSCGGSSTPPVGAGHGRRAATCQIAQHNGVLSQAATSTGNNSGDDLISHLPDCILGEIVTRLSTVEAIHVQWQIPLRRHHVQPPCCASQPARRIKLDSYANENYNPWLRDPALNGLQVLEIQPEHSSRNRAPLPPRALQFAPTLRVLKVGSLIIPSTAATLLFPHLEEISLWNVDISETTIHGLLVGCVALKALMLDGCTGFAQMRINSSTIKSLAFAPWDEYYEEPEVELRQVVIKDAPLLQMLVPFRHWTRNRQIELRVVNAPKLRVLGSLSIMISQLELGGTVFKASRRYVNRVTSDDVSREKRLLMDAIKLSTKLQTVKILALEDVDRINVVTNFLMCFPRLEKLYISVSDGFRSAAGRYMIN
ncbi:hypothetical protein QOZ80_7AG0563080 [Eleusine coracana subsp. coracana]|nr:hypothetical protein QOZ80_7AG0563080 [Eleusine coracana subsp. coracana]